MAILKENGHLWNNPELPSDRCVYCGRRIEHYRDFKSHFIEGESCFEQGAALLCESIRDSNPKNSDQIESPIYGSYHRIAPTGGYYYSLNGWQHNEKPLKRNTPSRRNKCKDQEIPKPPGYYNGDMSVFHEEWGVSLDD